MKKLLQILGTLSLTAPSINAFNFAQIGTHERDPDGVLQIVHDDRIYINPDFTPRNISPYKIWKNWLTDYGSFDIDNHNYISWNIYEGKNHLGQYYRYHMASFDITSYKTGKNITISYAYPTFELNNAIREYDLGELLPEHFPKGRAHYYNENDLKYALNKLIKKSNPNFAYSEDGWEGLEFSNIYDDHRIKSKIIEVRDSYITFEKRFSIRPNSLHSQHYGESFDFRFTYKTYDIKSLNFVTDLGVVDFDNKNWHWVDGDMSFWNNNPILKKIKEKNPDWGFPQLHNLIPNFQNYEEIMENVEELQGKKILMFDKYKSDWFGNGYDKDYILWRRDTQIISTNDRYYGTLTFTYKIKK